MTKLFLLGAQREIDTQKQVVEIGQIIHMEGYSYHRYVVCDIVRNEYGIHYKLIDLSDYLFYRTEIIRPLSQKYGIGYYYDETNPTFKNEEELKAIVRKAQEKKAEDERKAEQERIRTEGIRAIGRKRLAEILPNDAMAMIVGRLKQNDSDSMTDYYASSVQRTVILGFSKHTRDLFSEMRKYAGNFEGTAYLSENNEDYEHREKYSMGDGYYLGESKYSGWIIEKVRLYNRERFIEDYAYTAGQEENICIKTQQTMSPVVVHQAENLQFEIIGYSEKAIALFGDTKEIKDTLKDLGGRFNPRLSYNGGKRAGWIFATTKRAELNSVLNLK
ncbi:fusion protein [Bacteroides sp. 519]|uniref:fusion protein n=1 Tax=Bacteroides sp. 519 TaxID=2302937 RepID=UPI0013CFF056|nr:fusion protein [Bacteroides sp. 519]NDV57937.1 fusion protein [Bacteroides sp. 519]